jgi:hypothetical protein
MRKRVSREVAPQRRVGAPTAAFASGHVHGHPAKPEGCGSPIRGAGIPLFTCQRAESSVFVPTTTRCGGQGFAALAGSAGQWPLPTPPLARSLRCRAGNPASGSSRSVNEGGRHTADLEPRKGGPVTRHDPSIRSSPRRRGPIGRLRSPGISLGPRLRGDERCGKDTRRTRDRLSAESLGGPAHGSRCASQQEAERQLPGRK